MKKLNVVIVFDKEDKNLLMCKRMKDPYMGKFNLVGGKVEPGENELDAAYRELCEETGIRDCDIQLKHVMNFQYEVPEIELEVYYGKLNKDVVLVEEKHPLCWMDKNENFFDLNKFAGEGNIGHMLQQVEILKNK